MLIKNVMAEAIYTKTEMNTEWNIDFLQISLLCI